MEGSDELALPNVREDVLRVLYAADRRYPATGLDPLNIAWLFGERCDEYICDYLFHLRGYIRNLNPVRKARVNELARLRAKQAASFREKRQRSLSSPPVKVKSKKSKFNNRAIAEAQTDLSKPSSIEWALWRDDNPEYIKKTKSRKRDRDDDDVEYVDEPLSTRALVKRMRGSEEYTSASSESLVSSEF